MKLCMDCNHYTRDGVAILCDMGNWDSIELAKTKTFNPIMFECFDFDTDKKSSGFENDMFFDVFSGVMR